MSGTEIPALEPVQSSNIKAIGHRGDLLFVEFHTGALWRYTGVPTAIKDEMLGSGSIGRYFQQFIRPNHPGEKIRDGAAKTAAP